MSAGPLPARRWIADLVAAGLLLAVPAVGFWPTFGAPGYLVAALGAILLGLGIAALATWRGFGILTTAGITVAAYFLLGGALALSETTVLRVIPTLRTIADLGAGVVTSWKQLLTTVAPVPLTEGYLIVPFLLLLVGGVVTGSLALRAPQPGWALVPAAAVLVAQIALGTSSPAAPIVEGVLFAVTAAVWLAVRIAWMPRQVAVSLGESRATGGATRRIVRGTAVVGVAVVAGVALSGVTAPSGPRYVLRDIVIPPFDVQEYPSPLQSFRGIVRDYPSTPLFTVSGLPEGARVRIAAMDAYSGTVYNVSDTGGAGSSSAFIPVRDGMSPGAQGADVNLRFEIGAWDGVWLPEVGAVESITFAGEDADDLRRASYYNAATQTAVVSRGLAPGDAYDLKVVVPAVPSDDALADVAFAPVTLPTQTGVPEDIAGLASDFAADAETPIEQVRALQKTLAEQGFFSHGLEGQTVSRAGHGAERITALLGAQQMIGDDEQYAVAMTLMARELGIPARVVMGFVPPEDAAAGPVFSATGEDLKAWVEVAFDGVGWVPFDPTPPEDQVPSDVTTKPRAEPKPQVLQPPPPIEQPAELPPTVPDEREADENDDGSGIPWGIILAATGISLLVLALLAAPIIVIGALKAARRRARRSAESPSDRISGGWDELVDRASDYGTSIAPGGTRVEAAGVLSTALAQPRVATLAEVADVRVFGPGDPTPDEIDAFWTEVDEIVGGFGTARSPWGRLRARLSLRSLLAGTRLARLLPASGSARGAKPASTDAAEGPADGPSGASGGSVPVSTSGDAAPIASDPASPVPPSASQRSDSRASRRARRASSAQEHE